MEGVWSFEEASRIGSIRKHPVYGEQLLRKKMNKKVWELFIHKVDVYLSSMLTDYSELTFNEKRIYWDQFANPGFGIEGVEDVLVSTTRLIRLIDFNFADPQTFLQDCLSWFNNTEIKRRTLVFVGPADSFKSWIARGMGRLLGKAAKKEPLFLLHRLLIATVGCLRKLYFRYMHRAIQDLKLSAGPTNTRVRLLISVLLNQDRQPM